MTISQNDSIICGSTTDMDGKFEVALPSGKLLLDTIDIEVQFLGYTAMLLKDIPVNNDSSIIDLGLALESISTVMGDISIGRTVGPIYPETDPSFIILPGGSSLRDVLNSRK